MLIAESEDGSFSDALRAGAHRAALAVLILPDGRGQEPLHHVEQGKRRKRRSRFTTDEVEEPCRFIRNASTENTQDQPHEANNLKVQTSYGNLLDLTRRPVIPDASLLALSAQTVMRLGDLFLDVSDLCIHFTLKLLEVAFQNPKPIL